MFSVLCSVALSALSFFKNECVCELLYVFVFVCSLGVCLCCLFAVYGLCSFFCLLLVCVIILCVRVVFPFVLYVSFVIVVVLL